MIIATFLFFTALVGVLTFFLTRKDDHGTATGYFLAGRTLTGGFIAGSLLLTNLSTEQLVGLNGAAFTDGVCVMAWEVIAGASLVLMALYFLPKYLRSGIATIPQFLEERFDGTTRSITSFIFIIAYAGILLPIILYTGATGLMGILNLQEITGIENRTTVLWITVWFIGIVGSIYAIFGGLRTVAVSDTINGFGLLVGGVLITVFALNAVGDGGIFGAIGELKEAHPEKFNSLGGPESSVPFSTLFTGVLLLNLFYWTTNQQIIQRTFGASTLAEGQKGVLIAGTFKVLAPLILVLPGIIAFHLYAGREGFKAAFLSRRLQAPHQARRGR
jgi:SSS family solute:Na+ symporter